MALRQDLGAVVGEIKQMVETTTTSAAYSDVDLRRILSFLVKVSQVIDQAFSDVQRC